MEPKVKKERTKNFTEAEKMLLLELIQEKYKILENKATNSISIKEKEECWEDLQTKFASQSRGVVRSVHSLKTCWENMKKRTKKQYAEQRQAVYKTGGGPYQAINDTLSEQVREIIRPAVEGLLNAFDNDYIPEDKNNIDQNEEFEEEWLDLIEDGTEEEGDRKGQTVVGNRSNVNKLDMEENMDVVNWKSWNPKKLQTAISTPLRTSAKRNSISISTDELVSINSNDKRLKENVVPSPFMGAIKENSKPLKKNNNSNFEKFGTLAESKIELVDLMLNNGKEKHALEMEILKVQLKKEKLQVEIMQKELELKTFILDKEYKKLRNML